MKSTHVLVIGIVAVAAVAAIWGRTDAQAPRRAVAPVARVAVCDVGAVFNAYERRNDLNALFEGKRKQAKAEDDRRLARIKQIEKVLGSLNPGTKQHEDQLREMQKLSLSRQVWRQFQEKQFAREHRLLMEQLYREVLDAIAATARQKGYDVVFYRDSVEVTSATTSELLNKIAQRKCLYNNPAIDLTAAVIQRLNRNYRAGKKG
jgi:Skp family chaperone for outer membrane proteins